MLRWFYDADTEPRKYGIARLIGLLLSTLPLAAVALQFWVRWHHGW